MGDTYVSEYPCKTWSSIGDPGQRVLQKIASLVMSTEYITFPCQPQDCGALISLVKYI